MRKLLLATALLSLGGCVSVPLDYAQDPLDVDRLIREASAGVETLVLDLGSGAAPDFTAVQVAIEQARLAVITRAAMGIGRLGVEQYASLGALGATLSFCQDGVVRLQVLQVNDPGEAAFQARSRFWPSCVVPLGLAAMQAETRTTTTITARPAAPAGSSTVPAPADGAESQS